MTVSGVLSTSLLGISFREASFAVRDFYCGRLTPRRRLECIGETFLFGYNNAISEHDLHKLTSILDRVEPELRGFAFEGAAMGLTLLDRFSLWRRDRFTRFLHGPGSAHTFMVHVGVGWVLARLHLNVTATLERLDPLLRWLAIDGYGFHEGYFHSWRSITNKGIPKQLSGYARRVFDQGLGRSLWFVEGADVERIATRISSFYPSRHNDLWSGVGLACAYAGGVSRSTIANVCELAGLHRPALAQGVAFAAKARQRAGNPASHTELASQMVCNMSAESAGAITDDARTHLPFDGTDPAYEVWRVRIQQRFGEAWS